MMPINKIWTCLPLCANSIVNDVIVYIIYRYDIDNRDVGLSIPFLKM